MEEKHTYKEFLKKLQKQGCNTKNSITPCLGSRDAWKWVRHNHWEALDGNAFDQSLYSKIINEVNLCLVDMLLEGHNIEFPYKMGCIRLSSLPTRVEIDENGNIQNTYGIDWSKTLSLWYEDEEVRNNHKAVKYLHKRVYFIKYYKSMANYTNKGLYKFKANRSLQKRIGKMMGMGRICAEHLE